jgi:ADP-ribosylglycohydrolase
MRAAPVGIRWRGEDAFDLAVDIAALTHGHPTGHLTAGVFALVVSGLLDDEPLSEALATAETCLARRAGADETLAAIAWARSRAPGGPPTPEELDGLNGRRSAGWVADEALAIALRCALTAEQEAGSLGAADEALVQATLLASVNHSGDSDSTGSMVGNLLGAALGAPGLPSAWRDRVELLDVMTALAADAVRELATDPPPLVGTVHESGDWWARYPGA